MNANEELAQISDDFWYFLDNNSEKEKAFAQHYRDVYQPGLFDTKTKRLMALCGAIIGGCKGCILGQTKHAVDNGATVDEIMEACSVMLSLGGTMACSEIAYVIQYLRDIGMIKE